LQSIVDLKLLEITLDFLKDHFNEKLNDIVGLDVPKLGCGALVETIPTIVITILKYDLYCIWA
jgi:hypothetical protein